jgi:3'(2'), 5'-bisphosphate nucleotidase
MGGEMRGFGSVGYKVSRLFFGEADIYVHQKGLKEWDTCAPEAVARALGWSVSTLSGAEHRYNRENPRNEEIVVCRPAFRDRVLESLRALGVSH